MSQSFQKSKEKLSKAIQATEKMQQAARDFLVAQTAFADSFRHWADEESNITIKDTYNEAKPLWDIWAAEQSEFIAKTRSFVYYEMGLLLGAAQDYMMATKETDKCRSQLKRKQDAAAKGGAKASQLEAQLPAAKQALEKAKITEARLRDKFTRLKHVVVKSGLYQMSGSYVKMCDVGSHLFGALNQLADRMPEQITEDDLPTSDLSGIRQIIGDTVASVPEPKIASRNPGIFLHKKAEKFGKEKKRFFQLERQEGSTTGAEFVYYVDVLRGLPYQKKGSITISRDTEVDSSGKEILLRNPDRKWILVAKTSEEARWWSGLLVQAKKGLPDHAIMKPCAVAESDITNIGDARLRLDTVARQSQYNPAVVVAPGSPQSEDGGERYVVNNEFKSEEGEGTLDLQVGDVVIVGEKGEDWWFAATLDGSKDGWCPAIFLDPANGSANDAPPPQQHDEIVQDNGAQDGGDDTLPGRYVRAAYDNDGVEDDELSFKEGDEIYQIQDADEYGWSRGILNGREGIYPAAYVEEIS